MRHTILAAIFAALLSCDMQEVEPIPQIAENTNPVVLGQRLKNPYKLSTMRAVVGDLKKGGKIGRLHSVRCSDLYIKFYPKDSVEMDLLSSDTSLLLFPYPMDYEIIEGEDYYLEPGRRPGDIPAQYCAVPVGKILPAVEYDIIDSLYLPEEDKALNDLEAEEILISAYGLTGNEYEPEKDLRESARWNPSGNVRVWDGYLKRYTPLEGVRVFARKWFRVKSAITDQNGNYRMQSFRSKRVNYSIRWERKNWSIRSGRVGVACLVGGTKKQKAWNVTIYDKSLQQFYAALHIGLYMYYNNTVGIKTPPIKTPLRPQLKVGAYNKPGRSAHGSDRRFLGIDTRLRIYRFRYTNRIQTFVEMVEVMVHEAAHASHHELYTGKWDDVDKIVKESWAVAVPQYVLRMRYEDFESIYGRQSFKALRSGDNFYTPAIIDLIDEYDQSEFTPAGRFPVDEVCCYTLSQLEHLLRDVATLDDLKNSMIRYYDNDTEDFLCDYFDQYDW